jgi:hypothetical protein
MNKNKLYNLILIACLLGYLWLFFLFFSKKTATPSFTVCLSKTITHYPCPACGTSRAVSLFFKGDVINSILTNPFGIVVSLIMIICPVWVVYDMISKKSGFYHFYNTFESILKRKKVFILFLILVIMNWIWNIKKEL